MTTSPERRSMRYLGDPQPVAVVHDAAGRMIAVVAGGRRRAIEAERDDWIVQDRWWTAAPIERHYRELVLAGGRVSTIYRDLGTGSWFGYGSGHRPAPIRRPEARRPAPGARQAG